jgi:hypothetical protein
MGGGQGWCALVTHCDPLVREVRLTPTWSRHTTTGADPKGLREAVRTEEPVRRSLLVFVMTPFRTPESVKAERRTP